ncbi:MAG: serine hydrolase domain-containing protein, partial [Bacteroidia bacterium]
MKKLLILTLFAAITTCGFSQQGIEVPGMTSCDNAISQFLSTYSIPSATMALGKDGQLVYSRAFGKADLAEQVPTQPYHMFRVASISKPITAIAIMKLAESGAIKLSDNVFGPEGILKNNAYFDSVNATDTRLNTITVQHLLEHTGGWDRDVDCIQGANPPYTWTINHCDPIGFPRYVTQSLNEPNPVSRRALVKFLMLKGLAFEPGTQYAYSNIGYLTLGLVIEEITGQSYESYVKEFVLDPIGACDMYIGKNMRADKREREGEYKGNGFRAPSIYGGALTLPWEYGGWNLEAMDAHGGWIATARDLVRVLCAIDNFSTRPDILTRTSINTMTTASSTNANYAKGWSVNQFNNWWHTGALDGTASIMVRSNNGYTWALILNHRIIDNRSNDFWTDMDGLPWSCIQSTTQWPAHDLFEVPSTNADTISFANGTTTSFDVNWVRGNGEKCIVVASTGSPVDVFPLDGVDYNADADFGSGDDLGGDQYVVYNGAGNSVNVKSLNASETYHFRVFEYNQNSKTGNHALYQLCASPQANAKPSVNVG